MIQIYFYWFQETRLDVKLILVGYSVFSFCVVHSIFLYISLGWIVKMMLGILSKKILTSWEHNRKDRDYWDCQLTVWKAEYFFISELVHYINDCFGPLLLVALTGCFVRLTNNLFTTLNLIEISNTNNITGFSCVMFWSYLAENLFLFTTITYTSYTIHQMVGYNLEMR